MWKRPFWFLTLAVLTGLCLPLAVSACPSCNAAVQETSGAEDEDRIREGLAYNQSIYLMVGMPYLLIGSIGVLIYRGSRLNALARESLNPSSSGPPES